MNKIVYGPKRDRHMQFECDYNNHHVYVKKERCQKETTWVDHIEYPDDKTTIVNVIGNMNTPTSIETYDNIIRVSQIMLRLDNGDQLPVPLSNAYSVIGYYANMFLQSNPLLKPILKSNFNIQAIMTICQHGIMFQHGDGHDSLNHYDLKQAYTTYDKCKYYTGFPTDISYCVSLGGIDFDEINNIIESNEGFVMVLMTCIWTNKLVTRWVSFPYYRFYVLERKDSITPLYAMISNNRTDLDLSSIMVTKRMWHYVLGYLNRTTQCDSYITTDPLLAKTGKGSVEAHGGLYRKSSYYTSVGTKYYPHISGYVQNYNEIRMERFVLGNMIKSTDIARVWIDGIYVRKKILANKEWHITEDVSLSQEMIDQEYVSTDPLYYGSKFTNACVSKDNVIIKGVGGTGKSTMLKALYDQTPNSIVLTPTNELKKQYPKCKVETLDYMITNAYTFKRYTTILIDEYTMVSQKKLDKLIYIYPHARLILSGDIGQLGSYDGDDIDEECFSTIILTKNYRQHNVVFQNKLNLLRTAGDFKFDNTVSRKDAINKQFIILSSTHAEIDKLNKLGLTLNDNDLIKGLKIGAPIRFYKTTKKFNAGEMGVIQGIDDNNIFVKLKDRVVDLTTDTFKKYHKLAYSVTYHAVQGKTIKGKNVAINTNRLFDKKMKYVGCSRVIDEDQLFLLVG